MHALRLALSIAGYQSWVDLGHVLSDEAEGGRLASVDLFLVTVCDWVKPVELPKVFRQYETRVTRIDFRAITKTR